MAKWKEIPSPEAFVRAALKRADHAAQSAANNAATEAEHVVIIAAVENIRSLASNPAEVAAILEEAKKAGERHD
jgi:hypothetical protein